ncbi:Rossmann-like and DUF2520 domain-containing protein [Acidobacteriota bacterium]
MKTIAIIGAGRLGASLGYSLSQKGYTIMAVSTRAKHSAEESKQLIGQGSALTDNIEAAQLARIIILSVPDDDIPRIVKELVSHELDWKGKLVFHCSGLYPSSLLHDLESKGALTASVHPNQSFPRKFKDANAFQGVYFALEGSEQARDLVENIVRDLGGHSFIIRAEDKSVYHAACSVASNFFVALLDVAVALLQQCGLEPNTGRDILLPLVERTLQNVKKLNTSGALSGPIVRGDHKSVKDHLDALEKFPPYHQMYIILASQALEIAKRRGEISPDRIKALEDLLGRK